MADESCHVYLGFGLYLFSIHLTAATVFYIVCVFVCDLHSLLFDLMSSKCSHVFAGKCSSLEYFSLSSM